MKILTQMLQQFQRRHKRLPEQIVVDPVALTALALRRDVGAMYQGVAVICRDVAPTELKGPAKRLGVYIEAKKGQKPCLRAFDLD